MKTYSLLVLSVMVFWSCSNSAEQSTETKAQFTVQNTLDMARKDASVAIAFQQISSKFPQLKVNQLKFVSDGNDVPFQTIDTNGDDAPDQYLLVMDLKAGEEKNIQIEESTTTPNFKKRTQAELSHKVGGTWKDRKYEGGNFKNVDFLAVPPEHTDHSHFIRYEGPGWESDLVGYRFYLDWRNATDIFGKKTRDMVLQQVGQDGFDSYHEPADWGMDVLKVGKSLGIGALGSWMGDKALRVETTDSITCEVAENGALESMIRTKYYEWKVGDQSTNLTSDLSIQAGSRLTRHDVALTESLPNLCTGIVKHENGSLLRHENGTWGYMATWGQQSLAEDHLGMAVLYKKADLQEITEDEFSHVVVLTPNNNELTYYFLAAWEQEPGGIHTEEAFRQYLDEVIMELGTPVAVKF